jgi:hypothetical protein
MTKVRLIDTIAISVVDNYVNGKILYDFLKESSFLLVELLFGFIKNIAQLFECLSDASNATMFLRMRNISIKESRIAMIVIGRLRRPRQEIRL